MTSRSDINVKTETSHDDEGSISKLMIFNILSLHFVKTESMILDSQTCAQNARAIWTLNIKG